MQSTSNPAVSRPYLVDIIIPSITYNRGAKHDLGVHLAALQMTPDCPVNLTEVYHIMLTAAYFASFVKPADTQYIEKFPIGRAFLLEMYEISRIMCNYALCFKAAAEVKKDNKFTALFDTLIHTWKSISLILKN